MLAYMGLPVQVRQDSSQVFTNPSSGDLPNPKALHQCYCLCCCLYSFRKGRQCDTLSTASCMNAAAHIKTQQAVA